MIVYCGRTGGDGSFGEAAVQAVNRLVVVQTRCIVVVRLGLGLGGRLLCEKEMVAKTAVLSAGRRGVYVAQVQRRDF